MKQNVNSGERRRLWILAAVCTAVLLLALIPILINVVTKEPPPENSPNTGETLSGTYTASAESGDYVGGSSYTFEQNRVTNVYFIGTEEITLEYTYVIAIENGVKVLYLTDTSGVEKTYPFDVGQQTVGGVKSEFISINDVLYFKK